jgi:hypothetical protein
MKSRQLIYMGSAGTFQAWAKGSPILKKGRTMTAGGLFRY